MGFFILGDALAVVAVRRSRPCCTQPTSQLGIFMIRIVMGVTRVGERCLRSKLTVLASRFSCRCKNEEKEDGRHRRQEKGAGTASKTTSRLSQ